MAPSALLLALWIVPMTYPVPANRARTGEVAALRTPASEMILIPRSTFSMGSQPMELQLVMEKCKHEPRGAQCDGRMFTPELAQHRVTLSSYWLDRYEVSVASYNRCVEAGTCEAPPYDQGGARFARDDYPVALVSWNDAQTYCRWIGKRLPTEAEWERAARGAVSRRFPWGDHYATRRANHGRFALEPSDESDGYAELAPIGSFPDGRTPEGFYDLAGNVSEWVADNYEDAYEAMPVTDPKGPSFGAYKVVRGGCYLDGLLWLRGASRNAKPPSTRVTFIGFRCAKDG